MKSGGYMKDALILFVITLVSGFLLGGAYQITKAPIEKATLAANIEAYKAVFPEASDFKSDDKMKAAIETCNTDLTTQNFGKVGVNNALQAVDGSGTLLGYVITSHSDDSYGGTIELSVGIKADGSILRPKNRHLKISTMERVQSHLLLPSQVMQAMLKSTPSAVLPLHQALLPMRLMQHCIMCITI